MLRNVIAVTMRAVVAARFSVMGVLHEQEEFSLGFGVEEQGSGADVSLVGDLLRRDILDSVFSKQFAGGGSDAVELLLAPRSTPSTKSNAHCTTSPRVAPARGERGAFRTVSRPSGGYQTTATPPGPLPP